MYKVVRIISLVIIVPCSLIGFVGIVDEFISNFNLIIDSKYLLEPGFLLSCFYSFLSIPFILFHFKVLIKKKVKLDSIIDNEFTLLTKEVHLPKWIFIGNALFGLYNLLLGICLFIHFIGYKESSLTEDLIRNFFLLLMLLIGILTLLDKKNLDALKGFIADLYSPPWETRRMR